MPAKDKKETKKELPEVHTKPKKSIVEDNETEEVADTPESPESEKPEAPNVQAEAKITSFSQLDTDIGSEPKDSKEPVKTSILEPPAKKYEVEEIQAKAEESPVTQDDKSEVEKENVSSTEIKEWLKEVRPDTTKEIEKKGGPNLKLIFLVLFLLALIASVVGGIYYYKNNMSRKEAATGESESSESEINVTNTPTPTSEPTDFSKYSVRVLNGSGIPGEAGKALGLIKDVGFADIKTGNAGSYNFTTTVVSLKKDAPSNLYDTLKEKLEKQYIVEKDSKELEESSEFDIIVTVGTKKAN